jgi:hypothetical protein
MKAIKLTILLFLFVCNSASALSIRHVSHNPRQIDFIKNNKVTIRFALDESAQVVVKIYDDRDLLVRSISSAQMLDKGEHNIDWDGRDQASNPVPAEAYRYTLTATNGSGSVEHDLSDFTGAKVVKVHKLKWDQESNNIQYHLLKPARVNIRVGRKKNGPLLATVIDWVSRDSGLHKVDWNGYDNSGVIDISKIKDYDMYAQAFTLSENTILVGPASNEIKLVDITWKEEKRVRKKTQKKRMKKHSQQYIENRGDFTLKVTLPESLAKNEKGIPIVSKRVPVRFNVPAEVQQRMLNDRFEPILFVDGEYKTENEVGFFPMTWNWDPKDLKEGIHILTVNFRGYDGHLGSASVMVFVKR